MGLSKVSTYHQIHVEELRTEWKDDGTGPHFPSFRSMTMRVTINAPLHESTEIKQHDKIYITDGSK